MIRTFFISASILALAACGGSGGGGSAGGGSSFDDVLNDFERSPLFSDSGSIEGASFDTLAAAGGAEYSGQSAIYLDLDNVDPDFDSPDELPTPDLLGNMNLSTSFGGTTNTISGSMTGFVDSNDNAKTGSIELVDGEIIGDETGTIVAAFFEGELSGAGAGSQDYQGAVFGVISQDGDVAGVGVGGSFADTEIDDITTADFDDLEPEYLMIIVASED